MDLYQLYHMFELTEDEIDDEDKFQRHRLAILGAVVFFSGAEVKVLHANKQEKRTSFEVAFHRSRHEGWFRLPPQRLLSASSTII